MRWSSYCSTTWLVDENKMSFELHKAGQITFPSVHLHWLRYYICLNLKSVYNTWSLNLHFIPDFILYLYSFFYQSSLNQVITPPDHYRPIHIYLSPNVLFHYTPPLTSVGPYKTFQGSC
ncbi:hypothetical protein ACN38_g4305 [Penicillium nordicum]|uniref:Uncharacterized protein n=1 Tax=Penicillium nordicum TaxID=229535 RepID=A0A0M8PAN6_9EURO|nr:hypothetical protein ACN38_g4305 [Penicillium nordicum]